jgi:hypothetical protein
MTPSWTIRRRPSAPPRPAKEVSTEFLKDSARRDPALSLHTILNGRTPSTDQIDEAVT